jgi:hypothetical protein
MHASLFVGGPLEDDSGKIQGRFREDSGKIQGRFREDSGKFQGTFVWGNTRQALG